MKALMIPLMFGLGLTGCLSVANNQLPPCHEPKPNPTVARTGCLNEGIAIAHSANNPAKQGFVNADGKWVIAPTYDMAFDAQEGFALVVNESGDAGYQFLHLDGTPLNDKKYDGAYQFFNGFARVQQGDLYAYLDKQGNLLTPYKYEWAESFNKTFAVVRIGEKWGLIDKTGKEVLPIEYDWVHHGFGKSGAERYLVCKKIAPNHDKKCGFMDNQLNLVIPMQYDEALHFGRFGIAWVKKDGKEFFIDEHGKKAHLPTAMEKILQKTL